MLSFTRRLSGHGQMIPCDSRVQASLKQKAVDAAAASRAASECVPASARPSFEGQASVDSVAVSSVPASQPQSRTLSVAAVRMLKSASAAPSPSTSGGGQRLAGLSTSCTDRSDLHPVSTWHQKSRICHAQLGGRQTSACHASHSVCVRVAQRRLQPALVTVLIRAGFTLTGAVMLRPQTYC